MGDYNIDINVNMGGSQGNFQTLIDSVNNLNTSFQKVGVSAKTAGQGSGDSFAKSMQVMAKYGNETKNVQAKIDQLKQSILAENQALAKGVIDKNRHTESTTRLNAQVVRLNAAQRQYNAILGQTAVATKTAVASTVTARTAVMGLTAAFNKLGAVMGISFGLYGVFRAIKYGVKVTREFELAQKKLQSIIAGNTQDMKVLSESAINLGKNSSFGAKGVSMLQIELAKMGFSKDSIVGMQQAIVNLATATQEDLGKSAEAVANILRNFKLSAEDATRVTDVMGLSFNQSALQLDNFKEAMKYAGINASQAGFSIEETVAVLETLANAGLKGSLAGTSFNNILKAMGDSNSKLSKALGGTVRGYDGLIKALEMTKEQGLDTYKIITQRAVAGFNVLKEGTETMDKFRDANMRAAGTMERKVAVQLDTIANKAKLAGTAFSSMILDVDSGSSAFSNMIKDILDGFAKLVRASDTAVQSFDNQLDSVVDLSREVVPLLSRYDELTKNSDRLGWKTKLSKDEHTELSKIISIISAKLPLAITQFDEYGNAIAISTERVKEFVEAEIARLKVVNEVAIADVEKRLKSEQDLLDESNRRKQQITEKGYFDIEYTINRGNLRAKTARRKATNQEMIDEENKNKALRDKVLGWEAELARLRGDALADALKKKTSVDGIDSVDPFDPNAGDPKEWKKAIQLRYKNQTEMLALIKKFEDERIVLEEATSLQSIYLIENEFDYKSLVAKLELDMARELKENLVAAEEQYNVKTELIRIERLNAINALNDKEFKDGLKIMEAFEKERKKRADAEEKARDKAEKEEKARLDRISKYLKGWRQKNPILNLLFGDKLGEDLLAGLIDQQDIEAFTDSMTDSFSKTSDALTSLVSTWTDSTDRIVDLLNRQVDETQSALDNEITLMAAGYASNVGLKKKELAEIKKLRDDALKDQAQAQKAQMVMDSAMQISGLVTAAVNVMAAESRRGILGVALGIAAIATIFATIQKSKALAKQTSLQKFEEGGWVGGERHSRGGTVIEAEHGEFVVRRKPAMKHKALIEAINKDDKYEINRTLLANIKNQGFSGSVSLDDSKDLKAIRALMEKDSTHTTYANGYRIETNGIVVTKIKLN